MSSTTPKDISDKYLTNIDFDKQGTATNKISSFSAVLICAPVTQSQTHTNASSSSSFSERRGSPPLAMTK